MIVSQWLPDKQQILTLDFQGNGRLKTSEVVVIFASSFVKAGNCSSSFAISILEVDIRGKTDSPLASFLNPGKDPNLQVRPVGFERASNSHHFVDQEVKTFPFFFLLFSTQQHLDLDESLPTMILSCVGDE